MTALSNPGQFAQLTQQQQLEQAIQAQVHATMNQYYQAQAASEQAAQPADDPLFDRLLAKETKLLDAAIRSNAKLSQAFGQHSFEDAIEGKAGDRVQELAKRIDSALHQASLDSGVAVPLSDPKAIRTALIEGTKAYASLAVGTVNEQSVVQFAADIAAGSPGRQPDGDGEGHGEQHPEGDIDMSREGPNATSSFDDLDPKEVEAHYKSTMEGLGHQFEVEEPTLLAMSDSFDENYGDPDAA